MKRFVIMVGASVLIFLAGCSSRPPLAPMGFDKRPANTAEVVASLEATGDHTPAEATVRAQIAASKSIFHR